MVVLLEIYISLAVYSFGINQYLHFQNSSSSFMQWTQLIHITTVRNDNNLSESESFTGRIIIVFQLMV